MGTRIKRGKLASVKEPPDRTGTVYVLLEANQTDDQTPGRDELVEALRDQLAYLRGVVAVRDRELGQRAEEIRRRDAALDREQQPTAMFATRLGELEAPQAPQEPAETVEEAPEGTERPPMREGLRRPRRGRGGGG